MDVLLVKLVQMYLLVVTATSGLTQAKESEFNEVLVLHYNGINIYVTELDLKGFLDCLGDVYSERCEMSTQPSNATAVRMVPKKVTTKNHENKTLININCSLHQDYIPSNISFFTISCVEGELPCDTVINVKTTHSHNTSNTLSITYQINWQQPVSVTLINNSFDIISLDTCNKYSTNTYIPYIPPLIIITTFLISIIFTFWLRKKTFCRLSYINSYDVVVSEDIESSLYCNIRLAQAMNSTVDSMASGKSICLNENNDAIGTQTRDRSQQAGSVFSVYVNFKENDSEAIQNHILEGDQTQLTYYVLEPETESFGDDTP